MSKYKRSMLLDVAWFAGAGAIGFAHSGLRGLGIAILLVNILAIVVMILWG